MKILADVNVEAALVDWLRSQHHDVTWANDLTPGIPDDTLLQQAQSELRVFFTYDRDFGELVYRRRLLNVGVVLLRFEAPTQAERLELLKLYWPEIATEIPGNFLVVTDSRLRVRPLP